MRPRNNKFQEGTVLILALWALAFLTVFTVSVGMKVQQKIMLASRLENRTRVYDAAEAGIRKAVVLLKIKFGQIGGGVSGLRKTSLFNAPTLFKDVPVGPWIFDVSYPAYDGEAGAWVYGVIDEERKINVNVADRSTLEELFRQVTSLSQEAREDLASAIIDWREFGESGPGGFLSDAYYENLRFPYKEKKSDFETLDELLLLRGMTPGVFQQLSPYVTVYGNGQVNINTAPRPVLQSLGMSESLVEKTLAFRRGPDGREATLDDPVFSSGSEMTDIFSNVIRADPEEVQRVNYLFGMRKIGMESSFFMIKSRGYSGRTKETRTLACVFDLNSGKIKYWREH